MYPLFPLCCVQNEQGTALHVACLYHRAEALRALLRHRLKPDVKNAAGVTPLEILLERRTSYELRQRQRQKEERGREGEKVGNDDASAPMGENGARAAVEDEAAAAASALIHKLNEQMIETIERHAAGCDCGELVYTRVADLDAIAMAAAAPKKPAATAGLRKVSAPAATGGEKRKPPPRPSRPPTVLGVLTPNAPDAPSPAPHASHSPTRPATSENGASGPPAPVRPGRRRDAEKKAVLATPEQSTGTSPSPQPPATTSTATASTDASGHTVREQSASSPSSSSSSSSPDSEAPPAAPLGPACAPAASPTAAGPAASSDGASAASPPQVARQKPPRPPPPSPQVFSTPPPRLEALGEEQPTPAAATSPAQSAESGELDDASKHVYSTPIQLSAAGAEATTANEAVASSSSLPSSPTHIPITATQVQPAAKGPIATLLEPTAGESTASESSETPACDSPHIQVSSSEPSAAPNAATEKASSTAADGSDSADAVAVLPKPRVSRPASSVNPAVGSTHSVTSTAPSSDGEQPAARSPAGAPLPLRVREAPPPVKYANKPRISLPPPRAVSDPLASNSVALAKASHTNGALPRPLSDGPSLF